MTSNLFLNVLSYFAIGWLFAMATFGTIDLLVSVGLHAQEWLRAHLAKNPGTRLVFAHDPLSFEGLDRWT